MTTRIRAVLFFLAVAVLFAGPVGAQTATPGNPPTTQGTFSLTASAVALPGGGQTVAGTVMGETYSISNTISVRADELLAPGQNMQGYFGGVQWFPNLTNLLSKSKLSPTAFQPYVTASGGVDIISPANAATKQHVAVLVGGGINYDPSSTGHFSVNLIEVRYAKLPGVANNTAIVSSGLKLTF